MVISQFLYLHIVRVSLYFTAQLNANAFSFSLIERYFQLPEELLFWGLFEF
jgi:hypothetical protein